MENERIDRQLALLYRKTLASHPNPINLDAEKKRFFHDTTSNPHFLYEHPQANLDQIRRELEQLKPTSSVLGRLLRERIQESILTTKLLKAVGTNMFTSYAKQLYSTPSKELVQHARKILEQESDDEQDEQRFGMRYNTISATKRFLDSFLRYGLHWNVEAKPMVVQASFNVPKRTLYINSRRKFSDADVKRLVVHEIGTHIVRAENARQRKYRLFTIGFPGYLKTEEGLAVVNEERAGLLSQQLLKIYAGRVLAVELALKNSFRMTYNHLREYFLPENAWQLTLRAKRGLADTSRPGALTKDHVYLQGWYDVKAFLKRGGSIKSLYIGKIGIQHVHLIKHINGE